MATFNTQSFSSLVSNFAGAVQGACSSLVDFTIGSILRAIDEAVAYVALWLQGLALQVAALTRASTSNGTDLDSWFAQFGFTRLPGAAATMQETFGRYTATAQALIYPGAIVQSQDGSVIFQVIADTTNGNWNATLGAYVLPAGTTSINVTVQCAQLMQGVLSPLVGTVGNVQANTINLSGSSIAGVDYVNNAAAATSGVNAETDTAARARFVTYIASLEGATLVAVQNAIAGVQPGMTGIIIENKLYSGATQYGYFTAIVNDGTGTANSTELANAGTAIEAARPLTVTFGVFAPTPLAVNIAMSLTTGTGYTHSAVVTAVIAALTTYIKSLQVTSSGGVLPYSILSSIAYAVLGVTNVTSITLNGGTADLTVTGEQAFTVGTITVT
jgi:uncharacterized phage protein gp47/JayE